MEFLKYCENKDIIQESIQELEILEEGWGIKLTNNYILIGGILVASAILFPFFGAWKRLLLGAGIIATGEPIQGYQYNLTKDKVEKIFNTKEIQNYLNLACKHEMEKLKKYYKNIKISFSKSDFDKAYEEWQLRQSDQDYEIKKSDFPKSCDDIKIRMDSTLDSKWRNFIVETKTRNNVIFITGDTDHIESVYIAYTVSFKSSKTKEEFSVRRYHKLPSPTDENIKKLGYRQEDKD